MFSSVSGRVILSLHTTAGWEFEKHVAAAEKLLSPSRMCAVHVSQLIAVIDGRYQSQTDSHHRITVEAGHAMLHR